MPEWDWNLASWIIAVIAVGGVIFAIGRGIFVIGRWVESVNGDRASFKAFIEDFSAEVRNDFKEVRADLKEIQIEIRRIFLILPSPESTVESRSPVQLTDFGRKISESANALQWATEHAPDLAATASDLRETGPLLRLRKRNR